MSGPGAPVPAFPFATVAWRDGAVVLIDQTRLPRTLALRRCEQVAQLCAAIRELAVRGAPALGIAAAYGVALAAQRACAANLAPAATLAEVEAGADALAATRPTAVNLFWALSRQRATARAAAAAGAGAERLRDALLAGADRILAEDLAVCRALGRAGAALLPDPAAVLTHCNAGGLATGGYGTALGVVHAAHDLGRRVSVFADETRPLLQGARLTAWEMAARGIPVTVLCDGAAASLLRAGRVDAVIVGADRIARNGDTANKIGTYPLAVLARAHGAPFYVAAPASTFDPQTPAGDAIPIEQRPAAEVLECDGRRLAPPGADAYNPAFDVTPSELITAFITERGVLRPPFGESLAILHADPHS